jgi:hypothetical protein
MSARAKRAYSFNQLYPNYTGAAIRVRLGGSGGPEADIGFVNYMFDIDALIAFGGTSTVYVVTWYDQSGNGQNAIYDDFAPIPIVMQGGVVFKVNGSVYMSINQGGLKFDNTDAAQLDFTISSVFSTTQSNSAGDFGPGMSGFVYADKATPKFDFGFGNLNNGMCLWLGPDDDRNAASPIIINDGLAHASFCTRSNVTGAARIYVDSVTASGQNTLDTGARVDSPLALIGSWTSPNPAIFMTCETLVFPSVISSIDAAILYGWQTQYTAGQ